MKNNRYILIAYILLFAMACSKDSASSSDSTDTGSGKGGSMARFTIAGDYLYTVDNQTLKAFSLELPKAPELKDESQIGFGIETISPMGNSLFIGTQNGMYIFDITDPFSPIQISYFQHIYSCDPVVSDGKYAYVTLSSSSRCGNSTNELQIIDIKDLSHPQLVSSVRLQSPQGLGVDNNVLFVCDDGLKIFDITNPANAKLVNKFNIDAYDVIPLGNKLLVIGPGGFYQYSYNGLRIKLLSHIAANIDQSQSI
jgi:hypothetical protein